MIKKKTQKNIRGRLYRWDDTVFSFCLAWCVFVNTVDEGNGDKMKITRYLNGVEISKNDLYSQKIITNELKAAVNEVRKRVNDEKTKKKKINK